MRSKINPPMTDDRLLWDSITAQLRMCVTVVADKLNVFSKLHHRPMTIEETADTLSLSQRVTEALVGNLVAMGYLHQHEGRFHLSASARDYLLPESPYYWGPMLQFTGRLTYTPEQLLASLEKDKGLGATVGPEQWDAPEMDPVEAREFTAAMHSHSFPAVTAIARDGDFNGIGSVLDVGGGSGCFCIAMADRHPDLRLTVFELPDICDITREYIAEFGFSHRVNVVAGNMFSSDWPKGHDGIFFQNIFHDWGTDRCEHLARTSFDTLPSGGRIYLSEMLLNDMRDGPLATMAFSIDMAFTTDGKQYSFRELKDLLTGAGFVDISVHPVFAYYSLVSGRKP